MDQLIVYRTAKGLSLLILAAAMLLGLSLSPGLSLAQAGTATHNIFMSAMEVKGATSVDKSHTAYRQSDRPVQGVRLQGPRRGQQEESSEVASCNPT